MASDLVMRGEREEKEREREREREREIERERTSHQAEKALLSLRNDPLGQRD